jgi:hypothetical protein
MAEFYLAKASRNGRVGLVPADPETADAIAKMEDGECVLVRPIKIRSLRWHRLYFALCREIGQNQDPARDEDSIDYELRVLAGHYNVLHARKGNQLYEVRAPKRIAFDKLTAQQWEALWPSLELAGRERFGNEYFNQVNVA